MIPAFFEQQYLATKKIFEALEERIRQILEAVAEGRSGIVVTRIKTLESAYEKAVLGNYQQPFVSMTDLLAASLVLKRAPNKTERIQLEEELKESFDIREVLSSRNNDPSSFVYDDLHYVLRLKDSPLLLNKELLDRDFELQVKSYLQYGWSICTHGINYKPVRESWRANRLVSQTKALVEVADTALQHGEDFLPHDDERKNPTIDRRVRIAELLQSWWHSELPSNKRRLAEFVDRYLRYSQVSVDQFESQLRSERGIEISRKVSINIHQAVLIIIIESNRTTLVESVKKNGKFLLITQEMEDISPACKGVPTDVRIGSSVS